MLDWFAKNMPNIDFNDIYYYLKPTDGQVADWDMLPDDMKKTYEKLGIPEAERKFLAGVTAQYDSETVYHRNRDELAKQGVLFTDIDTAIREYPEIVQQYLGTVIPPGDNKFAALNSAVLSRRELHLRAAGRARGDAAAGLLPHQLGERGPVRAHVDHRRRRLVGALRRGMLGAGVLHRLAALGRGRADRQAERAHPLHHDPELVAQRLQPRHQAGSGGDRSHRRMDRRQPRLQAHDEVPRRRDGRSEGARRGAVGRLCGRRPAPGRRGEDDPRRARDHVDHRLQVDLQGRRAHHVPRPGEGRGGRVQGEEPRALRRPDPRRRQPLRHVPLHGDRREGRPHRPRGHGLEGRRRPALLPDEPGLSASSRRRP